MGLFSGYTPPQPMPNQAPLRPIDIPPPPVPLFGGASYKKPRLLDSILYGTEGAKDRAYEDYKRQALLATAHARAALPNQVLNINGQPLPLSSSMPALLAAQGQGMDITDTVQALQAAQPVVKYERGVRYNEKDPTGAPNFIPDLDKGQEPLYDARGNIVGTRNMSGAVAASAQMQQAKTPPVPGAAPVFDASGNVADWRMPQGALASISGAKGAEAQATEGAKAALDIVQVPMPDGSTRSMPRSQAAALLGGGMAGGGFGQSQAPGDAEYAKNAAKDAADQYKGFVTAGVQAPGKIAKYRQIGSLLGNFEGGKLSPIGMDVASAANSLGFKMDPKWTGAQAADALSGQLVLDLSGGSLGTGFSNADRDFLMKQVPSIAQSAGARKTLIEVGVKKAERDQEVAAFARKWVQKAGRLDRADRSGKTFFDYMDEYANAHPLWAK
jgi:hypothetical protein